MNDRPAEFEGDGVRLDTETLIGLRAQILQQRQKGNTFVSLPGGFRIRQRGSGQDVADSRAYVAGDDLRHIDRGATARTGQIHTKTFHEERDRITHLVADFRPAMLWGMRRAFHSVVAAQALTILGWQSVEAGGRVGLLAITGRDAIAIPPRGRARGMLTVIGGLVKAHQLALHHAAGGLKTRSLETALGGLKRITSKGSDIIIATDLDHPGDSFRDVVAELAQRRYPHFLIVRDHSFKDLPPGRYPIKLPDGKRLRVGLSAKMKDASGPAPNSTGNRSPVDESDGVAQTPIDAGAPLSDLVRQLGI